MSGIVVVGAQWGDEGKGKLIDVFSSEVDYVVRTQGGANAGHTLVVDGQKIVLHLVPSGILHDRVKCIIGTGVVLDIEGIVDEIEQLKSAGFLKNPEQLQISAQCTVLLPIHKTLDKARESTKSKMLGTTHRGIGPAYEDRASRIALVLGDLYKAPKELEQHLRESLNERHHLITQYYKLECESLDTTLKKLLSAAETLKSYLSWDSSFQIHKALRSGKRILFEGAQGTLLDIQHGTYPYVTSSATIAGSACTGVGIGPKMVDKIVGISKAYTTRVGTGPFPTELKDEAGEILFKEGNEYGATTGRQRRCGWLDLVALRYAVRVNSLTSLTITKLDVLSHFDKIGICTGYQVGDEVHKEFDIPNLCLKEVKPIYEYLPGWKKDLSGARSIAELPNQVRDFIQFVSKEVGVPIDVVSVGPDRKQTLWIKPLF